MPEASMKSVSVSVFDSGLESGLELESDSDSDPDSRLKKTMVFSETCAWPHSRLLVRGWNSR